MKTLTELNAMIQTLEHLRDRNLIPKDVYAGAIAKIGADLSAGLSGELGRSLQKEWQQRLDGLKNQEFLPGDKVSFDFGAAGTKRAKVLSREGNSVKLDFQDGFQLDRRKLTSVELGDLAIVLEAMSKITFTS